MLCSTIIPTIGRSTLSRAVESALGQDLDPALHEIIVINDSGQPLERQCWQTLRQIKVIQLNRCGLNIACNTGAAVARGKYLNFLHDDDYLLPGGLRALIDAGERSGAGWIVGWIKVVDEAGNLLFVQEPGLSGNLFAFYVAGEVVHMCQSLVRRDMFFQVAGFDPAVKIAEDRDLGCRAAFVGDFASTEHIVVCVRVSGCPGSAYDFSNMVCYARLVREKALSIKGATRKLMAAVNDDTFLRGRVCRGYLFSAILNLQAGNFWLAASRFYGGGRVASYHQVSLTFWKGMMHRLETARPVKSDC